MSRLLQSLQPMAHARSHFGAAAHGKRLYVFGGGGGNFKSLSSVESYHPDSDRWTECTPMPAARSGIAAATVGDRIYVMGGGFRRDDGRFDFKSTVDVYLPKEDRWESAPPLLHRHDAPAALSLGGSVYLFGGHHPDADGGPLTDPAFDVCEAMGEEPDGWRETAPLPTARFSLAALNVGDQIWAMGGGAFRDGAFQNMDRIEVYHPSQNRWSPGPTTLPWPSAGLYAATLGTTLWVAGGNDGKGITDRLACYHTAHDRWENLAPLEEARVMGALLAFEGALYLIGGREPDGKTPTATSYLIAPTTLL